MCLVMSAKSSRCPKSCLNDVLLSAYALRLHTLILLRWHLQGDGTCWHYEFYLKVICSSSRTHSTSRLTWSESSRAPRVLQQLFMGRGFFITHAITVMQSEQRAHFGTTVACMCTSNADKEERVASAALSLRSKEQTRLNISSIFFSPCKHNKERFQSITPYLTQMHWQECLCTMYRKPPFVNVSEKWTTSSSSWLCTAKAIILNTVML